MAWLTLQAVATETVTVLFLAREAPLFLGVQEGSGPLPPARSTPLSIITQAGKPLSGLITASTPRLASTANHDVTLAERCQPDRTDVIVAADREAAQAVTQECAVPLLVVRVSRQQVTPWLALRPPDQVSALYLEADPVLNLQLIRILRPDVKTVGVWVPTPAPAWLLPLRAEAQRLRFTLDEMGVVDDLEAVRALRPRLASLDAVLLPPDTTLINEWSLKPLLLMTLRQGVPVFGGLTARYVEAGVLAAVVADEARLPEQMRLFIDELAHGRTPAPAYPTAVRVVINRTVAQTLGISADAMTRAQSWFPRD